MSTWVPSRTTTPLLVLALTLMLLTSLPTPVSAQSTSASASSGAAQYTDAAGSVVAGANDAGDIPPAFSDNVTNGAEVVNEAMSEDAPSAEASISTSSAPVIPPSVDSAAADPGAANPAAEDLTTLPETGGAPLMALGAGLLLVAGGLCARRMFRQ